jgi:hypothetical protein
LLRLPVRLSVCPSVRPSHFSARSLTLSFIKGIWNNLAQICVITKRCVMRNSQTPTSRIKAALAHSMSTLSIQGYMLCPVHTFLIFKGILKILATIVYNDETIWHAQKPVTYLQVQGQTWRSNINILVYVVSGP